MTHALKILPLWFTHILGGTKTFEVRKHDRPFQIGDDIILQEYNAVDKIYTGKEWHGEIIYIMFDPEFVKKGYCILGIKPKE